MALASVTYTTSGVGPYPITFHAPVGQDLVVTLDDVVLALTTDYTLDTGNLNLTLVASSTGAELVIARETPLFDADLPVDWVGGGAITAQNMDTAVHDLNHKLQELRDGLDNTTGSTGPQGPQGDPGPPGADGAPGAPGAPGADGQDGIGDEMMIFMGL